MKNTDRLHRLTALLTVLFLLAALTGCTGPKPPAETTAPPASSDPIPSTTSGNETAPEQEDAVRVSTVKDLLEAIAPNVTIVIEPGYYNMSEYVEYIWQRDGESWNEAHSHVRLQDCYDGVDVVIQNVDGLTIRGGKEEKTEIVVDPRYAQVLNFENCTGITLSDLTMGHTDTGDCCGNVLNFVGCRNILLSSMDLYGCGVYGIGCMGGTAEVYVSDSTIRDCSSGALEILECGGLLEFRNCTLTGSLGYDRYEKSPSSELAFYGCVFGDNETSYYLFRDDIYTEDCTWSENYTYPEYGYGEYVIYDPDTMEPAEITEALLTSGDWYGYALVNPESGESTIIPITEPDASEMKVFLDLEKEGGGWLINGTDYDGRISWDLRDDGDAVITLADGRTGYFSLWTMAYDTNYWLLLDLDGYLVWHYCA